MFTIFLQNFESYIREIYSVMYMYAWFSLILVWYYILVPFNRICSDNSWEWQHHHWSAIDWPLWWECRIMRILRRAFWAIFVSKRDRRWKEGMIPVVPYWWKIIFSVSWSDISRQASDKNIRRSGKTTKQSFIPKKDQHDRAFPIWQKRSEGGREYFRIYCTVKESFNSLWF